MSNFQAKKFLKQHLKCMIVVGNDCNQYLLYKTEKANATASLIFSKKDRAVFEAPLTISGEEYYLEAVVEINKDKNLFYLHEMAVVNKKEDDMSFKTGTVKHGAPSDTSSSKYSLLNKLQNVNKNSNDVKYSLDRRLNVNAPIVINVGDILKNSIRINQEMNI